MSKNILLKIEYDGSVFHGWQRQPDRPTVQGCLEDALSSLLGEEITVNGTSRTDAGVHAYGQMASFRTCSGIPAERIALAVNNVLAGREKGPFALPPVRVVSSEQKPDDFHARFDAKGKRYLYRIRNTDHADIFMRNYVYHVGRPLDVEAMKTAAEHIKGTHDFKSFEASGGTPRETTVRTIFDIDVKKAGTGAAYACEKAGSAAGEGAGTRRTEARGAETQRADARGADARRAEKRSKDAGSLEEDSAAGTVPGFAGDLEISVSGDGFLYNMVRIITGTLVEAGLGTVEPEDVADIIEARDRRRAGHTAPPYGLYLAEVYY